MSGRAQPYAAGPNRRRDAAFLALACVMAALILLIVGVAVGLVREDVAVQPVHVAAFL